jgi:hypothetical protein
MLLFNCASARHILLRLLQFSLGRVTSDDDCTFATCAECSYHARLQPAASRSRHTSPTALHWLPIQGHITFKLCILMFQEQSGLLPSYLSQTLSSCQTSVRRMNCVPSSFDYILPRLRTKFGDRAFSYGTLFLHLCAA